MTSNEIRSSFLKFFESRGHRVVPSSPLVPGDDPTLLFTNAGMNQFKDLLLGREKRAYKRAATSQKVMRVSGKHNDLDNVGPSHRHHTFFEMLGNFSFGDYFKEDALPFAWALLTDVWKMEPSRMVVSIFKGENGIPRDAEAYDIWRKLGVPADRILELGSDDNFWSMGDTGPCGRCSEIYYVRGGSGYDPEIEIWNNVFMEFERSADGKLTPLPAPSIDTGMGLERITAVLQEKQSNYDTDVFQPLLHRIGEITGRRYGHDEQSDVSMRVVADHIRSTTFLIGDGVIPSNEWRGYVLRKIMRRAMRHGKHLGLTEPFLHTLVAVLDREMGDAYPGIRDQPRDDRAVDSRGGTPLRGRPDGGPAPPRGGDRQGPRHEVARAERRRGVQAVRHVRRAVRLHRGHRHDAGSGGGQSRLRARHGRPARQGAGEERLQGRRRARLVRRGSRRNQRPERRVSRLRDDDHGGRADRHPLRRSAGGDRRAARRSVGLGHPAGDAVLPRGRRTGVRQRPHPRREGRGGGGRHAADPGPQGLSRAPTMSASCAASFARATS